MKEHFGGISRASYRHGVPTGGLGNEAGDQSEGRDSILWVTGEPFRGNCRVEGGFMRSRGEVRIGEG